jgi:hypothetical protein
MVGTVTGVERPTPRVNGAADRFRRVGARIVLLVVGVPIRGWASPRTGSGVPRAGRLIIRSQTGVARRAAGVTPSSKIPRTVRATAAPAAVDGGWNVEISGRDLR